MITYPQSPAWSWPTNPLVFKEPEQWQPRKWVEQIKEQLRSTDLPAVAQHLLGVPATVLPATSGQALTPVGANAEPLRAVRDCVIIRQRGRQVVTAVRDANNHLQLLSWRVNADGQVLRTGESGVQPETVTQLAIAHANKFVVACRTASHQLKLISWDVSNTGAIYRAGESREQPAAINQLKLVALQPSLLLTAAITATGQLQLTSWQLDAHADLASLYQIATPEALRELALVRLPSSETAPRVLTIARTRRGDLRLQVWQVSQAGIITPLGAETVSGPCGTQLQAVVNAQGAVITALRSPAGQLRLQTWRISADGSQVTPLADSGTAGEKIRHQTLMALPDGVISAVTLPQGRLQLIAWAINANGQLVRSQPGDPIALTAHNLALCPELLDGNAPILTSLRTAQGGLQLITWQG